MADRRTIHVSIEVEDATPEAGAFETRVAGWFEGVVGRSEDHGVTTHGYQLAFGELVRRPDHRADVERGLRGGAKPE